MLTILSAQQASGLAPSEYCVDIKSTHYNLTIYRIYFSKKQICQ